MLLGIARLVIALTPFTVVRRLLGEDDAAPGSPEPTPLSPRQRERARHIGRSVAGAALHTPWRSDCYPQALAARTLLAICRIPHTVCFGVRREQDELEAHVWIWAGDLVASGGNGQSYAEVGRFVWAPR